MRKKVHPGDLAGGFSHLEMIWFLYCAGAATDDDNNNVDNGNSRLIPSCCSVQRAEHCRCSR